MSVGLRLNFPKPECELKTKSGKSLMNAFLRNRRAFGLKYLISFRAEHSDADRDITGIKGLLFRNRLNGGEKVILKIQSWRKVNTISQIFPKSGRISGPEVGDGA